jgi:hypothetical protein
MAQLVATLEASPPLRSTRRRVSLGTIVHRRHFALLEGTQGGTSRSFRESVVGLIKSPGKITMFSWFISPWIAARLLLEAQRDMAFNFLRLVSGQPRHQEVPSDGGPAPRLVDQRAVASVEPAISARSMATGRPKAAPARRAMGVVSKPISASKVKDERSTRKGKSRRTKARLARKTVGHLLRRRAVRSSKKAA